MTTQKSVSGNLHSAGRSSDMMHRQSGSAKSSTSSAGRSSDMLRRSSDGAKAISESGHGDSMKQVSKTPSAKVFTKSPFHG